MNWQRFCELNDVPPKYAIASIENLKIPPDELGSFQERAKKLISRPRSALLMGKTGRGKTYFMFALIRAFLCVSKIPLHEIRFFRATDLDARLLEETKAVGNSIGFAKSLDSDLLFIDDFGLGRTSESAERDYYDLIDRRVAHDKITILSTNLTEEILRNTFGARISSRLKTSAIIEFNGPNLREML